MVRVVLSCLALVVVGSQLISPVRADASYGWLSQASPQVANVTQLPSNQSPGISNRDCIQQSFNFINPTTGNYDSAADCMVQTTRGSMQPFGSTIVFDGTGAQLNPNYPYIPQPIPNQGMTLALTSAPVNGSYMHFYRDIAAHLNRNYSPITGRLLSFTVNAEPDFSLRDKTNALLPTNALGTLSYSSDGSWMLVDTPGGSFIRVNMATFDVLPFAPSLNRVGDNSNYKGITAISDDGQYAAISDGLNYFKVYDLSTCTGSTNNNYSQQMDCQSRDYWSAMGDKISGLKAIYSLRFINDDNISMTAVYDWQSGTSYDAAKFTITAPGKQAHSLDYLALGDSYISGEGEFQYKTGTDTAINFCHQSALSYPFIIGADLFNQYNSVACSGAVAEDIVSQSRDYTGQIKDGIPKKQRDVTPILTNFEAGKLAQWEFVKKYQPRVVTLSIGGNNIGFGKILQECITDNVVHKTCFDTYDKRMRLVQTIAKSYSDLRNTYSLIQQMDPGVQLYVIGYPQIVTHGSCGANVQLNDTDIDLAQNLITYLDWTIQQAASSAGARYVDTQNAFVGHRLCEANAANAAMNGITAGNDRGAFGVKFLGAETYHPNVLGHQLLAQAILSQTNNMKQPMPVANSNIAMPKPTDPQARALLANYPNSGKIQPIVVANATGAVSDIVYKTVGASVSIGSSFGLQPGTTYQASLDDGASSLGNFVTDASGTLAFNLLLPGTTSTGYHTLSITGTNMMGQSTEIYTTFYVAPSADDIDGNSVPDSQSQCVIVPDSGSDIDSDGIDDACDPVIGDVPKQGYPVQVHLTGNSIQASRP
jgi:hypothetical protein